jgi:hypothetical protein
MMAPHRAVLTKAQNQPIAPCRVLSHVSLVAAARAGRRHVCALGGSAHTIASRHIFFSSSCVFCLRPSAGPQAVPRRRRGAPGCHQAVSAASTCPRFVYGRGTVANGPDAIVVDERHASGRGVPLPAGGGRPLPPPPTRRATPRFARRSGRSPGEEGGSGAQRGAHAGPPVDHSALEAGGVQLTIKQRPINFSRPGLDWVWGFSRFYERPWVRASHTLSDQGKPQAGVNKISSGSGQTEQGRGLAPSVFLAGAD